MEASSDSSDDDDDDDGANSSSLIQKRGNQAKESRSKTRTVKKELISDLLIENTNSSNPRLSNVCHAIAVAQQYFYFYCHVSLPLVESSSLLPTQPNLTSTMSYYEPLNSLGLGKFFRTVILGPVIQWHAFWGSRRHETCLFVSRHICLYEEKTTPLRRAVGSKE